MDPIAFGSRVTGSEKQWTLSGLQPSRVTIEGKER